MGVPASFAARLKQLSFPGNSGADTNGSGTLCTFNTINKDDWYPQTGIDAGYSFIVPVGGQYRIYFQVRQPGYQSGGGFGGGGWSGSGGGAAWIRTTRGGSTLEDNIAKQTWSSSDSTSNNWMFCGPVTRTLQANDHIEFWTSGGATGLGVRNFDAECEMTKLKA